MSGFHEPKLDESIRRSGYSSTPAPTTSAAQARRLRQQLTEAQAALKQAMDKLREFEWQDENDNDNCPTGWLTCPDCGQGKENGHTPECGFAKILAITGAPSGQTAGVEQ